MVRLLLLFVLLLTGLKAFAVPEKDLWVYWNEENKASKTVVDHSLWQDFLDKYVKYSNTSKMYMVEYGRVKKADKDGCSLR